MTNKLTPEALERSVQFRLKRLEVAQITLDEQVERLGEVMDGLEKKKEIDDD